MTLTNSYLTTCAYALALRRASLTSALALLFTLVAFRVDGRCWASLSGTWPSSPPGGHYQWTGEPRGSPWAVVPYIMQTIWTPQTHTYLDACSCCHAMFMMLLPSGGPSRLSLYTCKLVSCTPTACVYSFGQLTWPNVDMESQPQRLPGCWSTRMHYVYAHGGSDWSSQKYTTGLKLENYYFFTFTFSRPEVRKLLLFYVFTFSRPEVRKLFRIYVFTFSRPEVRKLLLFYVFTFSRPEVRKLLLFYVFTFSRPEVRKLLLFYVFTFSRPEVRKLFCIYVFTFSRPQVGKLFRIYVFTFFRPQVRKLFHISMA